tara:strand:- start:8873 stop:10084 length:1212 start_codon:yes stop_codon:yes gene_type:complete
MKNEKRFISFMYPVLSGVMGGVQHQIINLITYYANNGYLVRLYDYDNGLIKRKLDEKEVKNYQFCLLDDEKIIRNLGDEVFILTGVLGIKYPLNFVNKNVKILIWDVYTPVWYDFDKVKRIFTIPNLKNDFIKLVNEHNGIGFMEDTGFNYFNDQIKACEFNGSDIIPVCLPSTESTYVSKLSYDTGKPLIIGYIGRAVDWKVMPLRHLITTLLRSEIEFKIKVITNNATVFKNLLDIDNENIEFLEGVVGEELDQYIIENINVGYSMGVSALELGKFAIPTILADFSKSKFDDTYRFQWLKDSKMYSLGKDVNTISDYSDRKTISQMLNLKPDLKKIGSETKDYVDSHHSIEITANKIIDKIEKTELYAYSYSGVSFKIYKLYYYLTRLFNRNEKFKGWAKK